MAKRTVYRVDIHLKGGTVAKDVTVFSLKVTHTFAKWEGGGYSPLEWVDPSDVSCIVIRDEYEIEVEEKSDDGE